MKIWLIINALAMEEIGGYNALGAVAESEAHAIELALEVDPTVTRENIHLVDMGIAHEDKQTLGVFLVDSKRSS